MSRGRKVIVVIAVAAIAVTAGVMTFAPRPIVVEMARVSRGPVRVSIEEEGQTRVRERYVVSAPVGGWMQRIVCEEGDAVRRGTVLGRVYPLPLDDRTRRQGTARLQTAQAAHEESLARLRQAETRWQDASKTLERDESLAAKQLLPPVELQQARDAKSVAEMEIKAARSRTTAALHEVETARAALLGATSTTGVASVNITAPVDGTVLRLYEECEKAVAAGAPVLEIGNLEDIEIVVDVLSGDATRVREGARMLFFLDATRADTGVAIIRRIEPSAFTKASPLGIEEQRVRIIAEPTGTRPRGDRLRVDAEVVLWEAADVVRLPTGALFKSGDAWKVFVVESGRARERTVQVGHRSPLFAEITGGLQVGETIIVFPPRTLSDGARVRAEQPVGR